MVNPVKWRSFGNSLKRWVSDWKSGHLIVIISRPVLEDRNITPNRVVVYSIICEWIEQSDVFISNGQLAGIVKLYCTIV